MLFCVASPHRGSLRHRLTQRRAIVQLPLSFLDPPFARRSLHAEHPMRSPGVTPCSSAPCRPHTPRPTRRYPRLRIWRPPSERQWDFNPPEHVAAQRTLWTPPTPSAASAIHAEVKAATPRRACCAVLSAKRTTPHILVNDPVVIGRLLSRSLAASLSARQVGPHDFTFEACSDFTRVAARWLADVPRASTSRLPFSPPR